MSVADPVILLLFEYPTISGGERSMLAVLDQLKNHSGLNFIVAAPTSGPLIEEFQRRGLRPVGLTGTAASGWDLQLQQIVREYAVDLVHANSLSLARRLGRVAPKLNTPCTGHLRDILKLNSTGIAELNSLTALLAVSQATRDFHLQQGVHASRLETIYNGVDLERFRPTPATGFLKCELGIPASAQLALNVGQICLRKGHDVLAQTAIQLKDLFPDLHWIVCGERYSTKPESIEFERRFQHEFHTHGLTGRLHHLGFRHDMSQIMNEVQVLVHTAKQEPLGRVLLEAAASALPIVATDVGGTAEILQHQVSGLLVPPDSPSATAGAFNSSCRILNSHNNSAVPRDKQCPGFSIPGKAPSDWERSGDES